LRFGATQCRSKTSPETRNPSALLLGVEIFTKNRGNQKVFGAASRRRSSRAVIAAAGRRAYTQN
jgi:hypothetical protein